MKLFSWICVAACSVFCWPTIGATQELIEPVDNAFFETHVRPIFVKYCYQCHSEDSGEQQGGLLLDRPSGWLQGGATNKSIVPGDIESSLLIEAIHYTNDDLQMPPDGKLSDKQIRQLEQWVVSGAPAPDIEPDATDFSRLGDQDYIFEKSRAHWAFQTIQRPDPPANIENNEWSLNNIDRFVYARLAEQNLEPSAIADSRTLARRIYYDLTGLPPTMQQVLVFDTAFQTDAKHAVDNLIDELLATPQYGQNLGRMWLDVARYADTDSFYRPDTKTPHYFPFAFTYRDYVIDAFNDDKPFDQFIKEQLAADLMGFSDHAPELAALGFLTVGPHANRAADEALDDWIDTTTRGLMGLTVACARCHDHKYEPVPTADYYSMRGIFAAVQRVNPLDEEHLPKLESYNALPEDVADYEKKRQTIDAKLNGSVGKKSANNNRSVTEKIRETELAELLLFHPGAPVHTMVVTERPKPPRSFIFVRGEASSRGDEVPRRFLKVLDNEQLSFPEDASGRLQLAEKIADSKNPLTARVIVNRVWGQLIGSYLVATPSDFGLQGSPPTHSKLLDSMTSDFIDHDWSIKHLVRNIVSSRTYQQQSLATAPQVSIDPDNTLLWRANRKRLSIEELRDSLLAVSSQLDVSSYGRCEPLWGDNCTHRRTIYGYINRFNLDPTLRAFDFPSAMRSEGKRDESIVAPQSLFSLNSPLVADQATAIVASQEFQHCESDEQRIQTLLSSIFQRQPVPVECDRVLRFVAQQESFAQRVEKPGRFKYEPWELVAQALMMSNEFQYVD